ncbi:MAG: energy transducer TonB [Gallionellaceae bacterium]|jgi:protein TonB|nr:energy transducer TonB [Gallionellaceae bacterium]
MNVNALRQPISYTTAFSVAAHMLILFGLSIALPDLRKQDDSKQSLEVVLVNAKSKSRPAHADALAQHNLDGGGNTTEDQHATTPLPALDQGQQFTPEQSAQRMQQLEQQQHQLMTQLNGSYSVSQGNNAHPSNQTSPSGDDLVQRSLEIARLEAQVDKNLNAYEKLPRRKFIGARTQEVRFAQYVEDWRSKVERFGNLNYPEAARQKHIFGSLQLTVSIRADGSLENVKVDRSSGQEILDTAAKHIVEMSAPFAEFPADIRKDTDIIYITRTWTFTQSDKLESK